MTQVLLSPLVGFSTPAVSEEARSPEWVDVHSRAPTISLQARVVAETLVRRLREISRLRPDWNGPGSESPAGSTIQAAARLGKMVVSTAFVPAKANVAASADGAILISLLRPPRELELWVESGEDVVGWIASEAGEDWEGEAPFEVWPALAAWLAGEGQLPR